MTILIDTFGLSAGHVTEMRDMYKHLHSNPELSMQETRTAEYIRGKLDRLGLETFLCGGTGVVGILRNGVGPVVGAAQTLTGSPSRKRQGWTLRA